LSVNSAVLSHPRFAAPRPTEKPALLLIGRIVPHHGLFPFSETGRQPTQLSPPFHRYHVGRSLGGGFSCFPICTLRRTSQGEEKYCQPLRVSLGRDVDFHSGPFSPFFQYSDLFPVARHGSIRASPAAHVRSHRHVLALSLEISFCPDFGGWQDELLFLQCASEGFLLSGRHTPFCDCLTLV